MDLRPWGALQGGVTGERYRVQEVLCWRRRDEIVRVAECFYTRFRHSARSTEDENDEDCRECDGDDDGVSTMNTKGTRAFKLDFRTLTKT